MEDNSIPTTVESVEAQATTQQPQSTHIDPPEMAPETPADETTDAPAPSADRFVRLRVASNESSWTLNMRAALEEAGIEPGDHVEVTLDWQDDEPMLLFGKLPETEVEDSRSARKVSPRGDSASVKPPRRVIEDEPQHGLGVSLEDYANSNPLLFEPLAEDGVLGLIPVGYESAVYAEEDTAFDHPLDEDAVSTAVQATGANTAAVREALAVIADAVDADSVSTADDYDVLEAGDVEVRIVPDRVWDDIQSELGLDETVASAAKLAHIRAAEDIVVDAGASEYRRFNREYAALVSRPTDDKK